MKRLVNRSGIMDQVDGARDDIRGAMDSVKVASAVGLVAFVLVALVAIVALAKASGGGNSV